MRIEALIQFHFLLELGQMPLLVSCITFTFIIYTQRESQEERERELCVCGGVVVVGGVSK